MELLSVLQILARRRWWVTAAAVSAIALTVLLTQRGPFAASVIHTGAASTSVQIDTAQPVATDLAATDSQIGTQAVLLSEQLADPEARSVIAKAAGIPLSQLTVVSMRNEEPLRPSRLGTAAAEAASEASTPYRVTVTASIQAPVIDVRADAPTVASAIRLARATGPALIAVAAAGSPSPEARILVRPLGGVVAAPVTSGAGKPLAALLAAGLLFFAGCVLIVVADRAGREMRRGRDPQPVG